jgi:hypothetical protein
VHSNDSVNGDGATGGIGTDRQSVTGVVAAVDVVATSACLSPGAAWQKAWAAAAT